MWRNSVVCIPMILSLLAAVGCGPRFRSGNPAEIKNLVSHYDDAFKEHMAEANLAIGEEVVQYESIASDVIPRKVTIHGSHRAVGRWLGLVAKAHYGEGGREQIRRKPESEKMNQRIIAMYEEIYPPYLDLVRGLAESLDLTIDEIDMELMEHEFLGIMWGELLEYQRFMDLMDFSSMRKDSESNCSIVSYYEADQNRHFIGRNFDNPSDRPYFVVATDVEGVYRTLGCACYFLYHWVEDGINEKGLFIGVATNAYPPAYNEKEPEYPDRPAIQVIHMVRIALETCATVEEAIERFRSVRIWFPCEVNHLLIADEAGDAAIVEFDRERNIVIFRRTEPQMIMTNTAYQEGIEFIREHCPRFRMAQSVLEAKEAPRGLEAVHDVMRIMRLDDGTLWTTYFDLRRRQMDLRVRSEGFKVPHEFAL